MARITNMGKRKGNTKNKLMYTNICVFFIYANISVSFLVLLFHSILTL